MNLTPRTLIALALLAAAPAGFAQDTMQLTGARNQTVLDQHPAPPGSHLNVGAQPSDNRVDPQGQNRSDGWHVANPSAAPEIDPASAAAAFTLLLGSLCLIQSRRRGR